MYNLTNHTYVLKSKPMPVKKIIKNKVNSNKQTRKTRCESCVHTDANDLRSNHFGDVFLFLFLVDYMTI